MYRIGNYQTKQLKRAEDRLEAVRKSSKKYDIEKWRIGTILKRDGDFYIIVKSIFANIEEGFKFEAHKYHRYGFIPIR